jgi:lipoate-protein ligase A
MNSPYLSGRWLVSDSGISAAPRNMDLDAKALDAMVAGLNRMPLVRFFGWAKSVITYGYLLDPVQVKQWADENGKLETVQRPTGGGAVIHTPSDVSVSLLWPRSLKILPDSPRACYAAIHSALKFGVEKYLNTNAKLFVTSEKPGFPIETFENDGVSGKRFSICFQEPVCNDVMIKNKKIIGGALRITREACLYQGTIQLENVRDLVNLKNCLAESLEPLLNPIKNFDPPSKIHVN